MSHYNSHLVRQKKTTVANKPASNSVSKNAAVISDNRPAQLKENKTGLPDTLKAGIENLGGMSMDHVKVHYNSGMPAQMQAHAYAQGSDIHVAPGQEKHLPHEAWHIVQQAKGRVKPTLHMGGVPVNNNKGLEKEADTMGAKAIQTVQRYGPDPEEELANVMQRKTIITSAPVQRSGTASQGPPPPPNPFAGGNPNKGLKAPTGKRKPKKTSHHQHPRPKKGAAKHRRKK
jgi:Domain of unknown function (DUF4157)